MSTNALAPHSVLHLDQMLIRKNFWVLFGAKFRIFDMQGGVVATSKQKAFKLKEDIRVFSDEAMTQELLVIKARQIVDFGAGYDVTDAQTGEAVGTLRRKGWKSLLQDEWHILDRAGNQIGVIQEESTVLALVRRFLVNLIPQSFNITLDGRPAGMIKQHFNPFIFKATMDLTADSQRAFDRRLAVASAVLILAIEGRQS